MRLFDCFDELMIIYSLYTSLTGGSYEFRFFGKVGYGFAVKYEDNEVFAEEFLKNYELATGDALDERDYESLEDFYMGGFGTSAGIYLIIEQYESDLSKWLVAYDAKTLKKLSCNDILPTHIVQANNPKLDKLAELFGKTNGALFHATYA